MKIIFIGTSEFGAIILEKLVTSGYQPAAVVTAPDKPVGRKQNITPPPVKVTAQKYNIPVLQPEKIGNWKLKIENYKPELVVVAAYGQILPQEILDIPKYGCLNIHGSLLPKYRGSSPIQTAILKGEKETGVTIIKMDAKMDHGPIVAKRSAAIGHDETSEQLHDRLAVSGAELLVDTIPGWIRGDIKPEIQDESEASYTKMLKREDGLIDWEKPPEHIDRQIRAFTPWPGAYTIHKNKRIKILEAKLENNKLIILRVKPEGKKSMNFQDFLRGNPDFKAIC